MSLGKKDIVNNISFKAHLSKSECKLLLESFLSLVTDKAKNRKVKLKNFGTFSNKVTQSRIGRNPKSKKEYKIPSFKKINFRSSSNIKSIIN